MGRFRGRAQGLSQRGLRAAGPGPHLRPRRPEGQGGSQARVHHVRRNVSEVRLHQKTIACSRQSSPLVTWPDDVSGTSGRASTPILSSAATARPGQFGPNGAGASSPVGGSPRAGRARQGTGAPRGGDRASPDPGVLHAGHHQWDRYGGHASGPGADHWGGT